MHLEPRQTLFSRKIWPKTSNFDHIIWGMKMIFAPVNLSSPTIVQSHVLICQQVTFGHTYAKTDARMHEHPTKTGPNKKCVWSEISLRKTFVILIVYFLKNQWHIELTTNVVCSMPARKTTYATNKMEQSAIRTVARGDRKCLCRRK